MGSALEVVDVAIALGRYRRRILPAVRGELRRWEGVAAAIPDPVLRGQALAALREKGSNAEATAVFAILAPRTRRGTALRAMTALQVAIDYLDTLGEQPAEDPLATGLALHEAVVDALSPGGAPSDWYRLLPAADHSLPEADRSLSEADRSLSEADHSPPDADHSPPAADRSLPRAEAADGGYLAALVAACRRGVETLPAWEAVAPLARRAARRCGEGQSHTHAAAAELRAGDVAGDDGAGDGPNAALRAWAERQPAPPGYLWWEVAAGACSSVAAHALIAAAADPRTTAEQAALIDAAYFPPIGALTVLLDDLLDREADLATGEHSYLGYYESSEAAAGRIALLAERARAATAPLPHARRHRAILAGVAGFYLSAPAAGAGYARPIRERLLESLGPGVRPIMAAQRRRRRG